jgi:hypothetical protein
MCLVFRGQENTGCTTPPHDCTCYKKAKHNTRGQTLHPVLEPSIRLWYKRQGRGLDNARQWRASDAVAKLDAGGPTADRPTKQSFKTTGWTQEHPDSLTSRLQYPGIFQHWCTTQASQLQQAAQCTRCMFAAGTSVALQLKLNNTSSWMGATHPRPYHPYYTHALYTNRHPTERLPQLGILQKPGILQRHYATLCNNMLHRAVIRHKIQMVQVSKRLKAWLPNIHTDTHAPLHQPCGSLDLQAPKPWMRSWTKTLHSHPPAKTCARCMQNPLLMHSRPEQHKHNSCWPPPWC